MRLNSRSQSMVATGSERELIEGCRAGDREAFHELFEAHKEGVYSIALRYSGDASTAMDITQDIFVKLFSRIADFRGESSFESWLYRVVVNCCLDDRRRHRRWLPLAEDWVARWTGRGNNLDEEVAHGQTRDRVRRAVTSLAPELRVAVVLRYTEGLTYDEIAEVVGCPAGTVASRLNRAHRELGRKLARRGGP